MSAALFEATIHAALEGLRDHDVSRALDPLRRAFGTFAADLKFTREHAGELDLIIAITAAALRYVPPVDDAPALKLFADAVRLRCRILSGGPP